MICFKQEGNCFQLRAAAIIEHEGRVLWHRGPGDDFWALPGGRVEMGESGAQTIEREMMEELGEAVQCGALAFVAENFFDHLDKRCHELGLYYRATLAPDSALPAHGAPFAGREPHLEFAWFALSDLAGLDVQPTFLKTMLRDGERGLRHVVQREA